MINEKKILKMKAKIEINQKNHNKQHIIRIGCNWKKIDLFIKIYMCFFNNKKDIRFKHVSNNLIESIKRDSTQVRFLRIFQ